MMWPSISKNNIEAMFNAYGGIYDSFDEFKKELLKCKNDKHACLVYKALQPTKEDTYCQIKAETVPAGFKMLFGGAAPNGQQQQHAQQQYQESQIGLHNIQTLPPQQPQEQQQQQMQPQQQQQWTPNFYQQPQMQQPQMQQQMMQPQPMFNLYQPQQYNPVYRFP